MSRKVHLSSTNLSRTSGQIDITKNDFKSSIKNLYSYHVSISFTVFNSRDNCRIEDHEILWVASLDRYCCMVTDVCRERQECPSRTIVYPQ